MGRKRLKEPVPNKKKFAIFRHGKFDADPDVKGDLYGTGLTREEAEELASCLGHCYPDLTFDVVPAPKRGTRLEEENP